MYSSVNFDSQVYLLLGAITLHKMAFNIMTLSITIDRLSLMLKKFILIIWLIRASI